jgi:NDP-sugar pyrophosphorylase family protein
MPGMKAMVLAAGLGDRLKPITDHLPKPLLPIANRPVMAYIIEHLARHGFTEIIANLHYRGDQIRDYFGDGSQFGVHLTYTVEDRLWGIAGGVRRCRDFFGDDTFLVIGADDLTDMDLTEFLALHRAKQSIATIGLAEVEDTAQFGIVVTDAEGRIQRFVEKPEGEAPSNAANTQVYLFEPALFDFIPPHRKYDFGFQTFPAMVAAQVPFYGFRLSGYWRDIGSMQDYLAAQSDLLEHRLSARLPARETRPGIWIEPDCEIADTARLQPSLILGRGATVGAHAKIGGGTAVAGGVHIPDGATIWSSVIWAGAKLPQGASLFRSVVTPYGMYGETDVQPTIVEKKH